MYTDSCRLFFRVRVRVSFPVCLSVASAMWTVAHEVAAWILSLWSYMAVLILNSGIPRPLMPNSMSSSPLGILLESSKTCSSSSEADK